MCRPDFSIEPRSISFFLVINLGVLYLRAMIKNIFIVPFLWVLISLSLEGRVNAAEWFKVLDCGQDQFVVDKQSESRWGVNYEGRQLVLRDLNVIRYFGSKGALRSKDLNGRAEFIFPVSASGGDDKVFQSTCRSDNNICYVIRRLNESDFRLEAWRTAYSAFGPQGLVADWVFKGCALSQNY
jgi:hypothetical protein